MPFGVAPRVPLATFGCLFKRDPAFEMPDEPRHPMRLHGGEQRIELAAAKCAHFIERRPRRTRNESRYVSHREPEKAVLIAGPTASGKSALALALAQEIGGAIVNADSMQVYRDLRVITARPTLDEEAAVPHRLYGHVDAAENYSVGRWLADVAPALDEVRALAARKLDPLLPAMKAHGVPWLIRHLNGEISLEEAAQGGKNDTRRYTKRQFTWVRHQLPDWTWTMPEEALDKIRAAM